MSAAQRTHKLIQLRKSNDCEINGTQIQADAECQEQIEYGRFNTVEIQRAILTVVQHEIGFADVGLVVSDFYVFQEFFKSVAQIVVE